MFLLQSHTLLSNTLNSSEVRGPYPVVVSHSGGGKTLIVHAANWGRFMGNLQVTFDANGYGPKRTHSIWRR